LNLKPKHILLLLLLLLAGWKGYAESSDPDTVCLDTSKEYWVTPTTGSTYVWKVNGVVQPGNLANITILWNVLGDFVLSVQETTIDNCFGEIRELPVHVKNDPPDFTVPILDDGYCVEDFSAAVYQPGGSYELGTDLQPPRPDYYLLEQGSTLLNISGITDDCTLDPYLTWEIDFAGPAPPDNLTGTGQISVAIPPEGIRFPVGVNIITWTVTDQSGLSVTKSVQLIVLPRPDIGDITY
jgi:hypothetical protein